MQVNFEAFDKDDVKLFAAIMHAATWLEACRMGMVIRNQLVNDGITVKWRRYF